MKLLGKITKGKVSRPIRLIVYGDAGVGKSTFAAGFPGVLFIDAERRTEHLDVSRIEVSAWEEILGVIGEVLSSDKVPYETLVFDTLDHIEHLIHDSVCKSGGVASIEDYGGGYGKGYTAALDQWRRFAKALEALRDKGIMVVMLAHGQVKTFKNPLGEDYDRWGLKMNAKAANFLREIADGVGFARFEDLVKTAKSTMDKAKAISTGDRHLLFQHSAAYESKKGIDLADEIELTYEALKEALKCGK